MSTQTRFTPSADAQRHPIEFKRFAKLTAKQKLVYYWLLAHSYYTPNTNHYFISNKLNESAIARELVITRPTVSTALKKLKEMEILTEDEFHPNTFCLSFPEIPTRLDIDIIKFLLAFHKYFDSSIIYFYSILRRLYVTDKGELASVGLTTEGWAELMGKFHQNVSQSDVLMMLAIYKEAGLVSYKKLDYTNSLGVGCVKFYITKVEEIAPKNLGQYFVKGEVEREAVDVLYKKCL